MIIIDQACPCGSGNKALDCCVPQDSPITRKGEGFNSVDLRFELEFTDLFGRTVQVPVTGGQSVLRKPQQISQTVTRLIEGITNCAANRITDDKMIEPVALAISILDDVLHSVRYHQSNFIYRLQLLNVEHSLQHMHVTGNGNVVIDDMPLRYELEAFVSRVVTVFDVLAKLIGCVLKVKKVKDHKSLIKHLDSTFHRKHGVTGKLHEIYGSNEVWIKEIKRSRNAIQHDGEIVEYLSFQYSTGIMSQPKFMNLTAKHICFKTWKDILQFVEEVANIIFK